MAARFSLRWPNRALPLLMAIGIAAVIAPLLMTRVLPFHDASGIVGLGGALALLDDPSAAITQHYDIDIRAYPSALYFGWAWLAGALGVPVEIAFNAFIAIFCMAGLPLATWFLLSAFRRPGALALLTLPVAYHHQIWHGFLGSSAANTGLVLALAFTRRLFDAPSLANHLGLAASFLFVAAAHPFPLALTLAVTTPLLLWPPAGDRRFVIRAVAARLATLVPAGVFLANWAGGFFGRSDGQRSLWKTIRTSFAFELPTFGHAPEFIEWLGNGYLTTADEWIPAIAVLTLLTLLVTGIAGAAGVPSAAGLGVTGGEKRSKAAPPSRQAPPQSSPQSSPQAPSLPRRDRITLLIALGFLVAGYLFLPMRLVWPELWWGVRVRCVLPAFLVALVLIRPRPRGLPVLALAPAYALGVGFALFVAYDLAAYFRGRVLAGFDEVAAALPPGQSVLGMTVIPDPHYTRPHPYLVQNLVARKGGRAVPHLRGHRGSYWITMRLPPDSPPWGDPLRFDFALHGDWDYFLIEHPLDAPRVEPLRSAPPGAVELTKAAGQFELWRRLR